MKDRYLKLTTSFITKYHTYDDDELDKLRYGLEGIYLSVTKLIIITLIAIIIGIIKEFILLLIFFNILSASSTLLPRTAATCSGERREVRPAMVALTTF